MCMCVGGELVEWVVDESACLRLWCDASSVSFFDDGLVWSCWMNAPGVPFYRVVSTFWSVLRAYLLEFLRGEVFNYLIEEPSCLRKRLASSIIILYCCLDSWTENICPGYSRVTAYSFCAVLRRAWSYPSGYSLVWSSTPEWLMLQTSNQRSWHVACIVIYLFPRPNCW